MLFWTGIDVDKYFRECKLATATVGKAMQCEQSCFLTLPWHISLKISFEIDDCNFEKISQAVFDFYSTLHKFDLDVTVVENAGNIVWVRYAENQYLSQVKDGLNDLLLRQFGVPMHQYDSDYIFHTTLFMNDSIEKNLQFYESIKNVSLPKTVCASKFAVGYSSGGSVEDYKIFGEIEL